MSMTSTLPFHEFGLTETEIRDTPHPATAVPARMLLLLSASYLQTELPSHDTVEFRVGPVRRVGDDRFEHSYGWYVKTS